MIAYQWRQARNGKEHWMLSTQIGISGYFIRWNNPDSYKGQWYWLLGEDSGFVADGTVTAEYMRGWVLTQLRKQLQEMLAAL